MKTIRYLTLGLLSLFIISLLSFAGRELLFSDGANLNTIGAYQDQIIVMEDKKETEQKPGEKKEPESSELDEDKKSSVTTLTFNFIHYLIYKFKPADVL